MLANLQVHAIEGGNSIKTAVGQVVEKTGTMQIGKSLHGEPVEMLAQNSQRRSNRPKQFTCPSARRKDRRASEKLAVVGEYPHPLTFSTPCLHGHVFTELGPAGLCRGGVSEHTFFDEKNSRLSFIKGLEPGWYVELRKTRTEFCFSKRFNGQIPTTSAFLHAGNHFALW